MFVCGEKTVQVEVGYNEQVCDCCRMDFLMPCSHHSLPTLFIDADACPVTKEALLVARAKGIPVVIAGNSTQNLERHLKKSDPKKPIPGFWVSTLEVGIGADAADFAIVERLAPHDVVVTQDIGLAAMVLGRGAYALGVRGREFLSVTIDRDMQLRHIEKKVRRQGGRTKGPAPFTDDDREAFLESLQRIMSKALQALS